MKLSGISHSKSSEVESFAARINKALSQFQMTILMIFQSFGEALKSCFSFKRKPDVKIIELNKNRRVQASVNPLILVSGKVDTAVSQRSILNPPSPTNFKTPAPVKATPATGSAKTTPAPELTLGQRAMEMGKAVSPALAGAAAFSAVAGCLLYCYSNGVASVSDQASAAAAPVITPLIDTVVEGAGKCAVNGLTNASVAAAQTIGNAVSSGIANGVSAASTTLTATVGNAVSSGIVNGVSAASTALTTTVGNGIANGINAASSAVVSEISSFARAFTPGTVAAGQTFVPNALSSFSWPEATVGVGAMLTSLKSIFSRSAERTYSQLELQLRSEMEEEKARVADDLQKFMDEMNEKLTAADETINTKTSESLRLKKQLDDLQIKQRNLVLKAASGENLEKENAVLKTEMEKITQQLESATLDKEQAEKKLLVEVEKFENEYQELKAKTLSSPISAIQSAPSSPSKSNPVTKTTTSTKSTALKTNELVTEEKKKSSSFDFKSYHNPYFKDHLAFADFLNADDYNRDIDDEKITKALKNDVTMGLKIKSFLDETGMSAKKSPSSIQTNMNEGKKCRLELLIDELEAKRAIYLEEEKKVDKIYEEKNKAVIPSPFSSPTRKGPPAPPSSGNPFASPSRNGPPPPPPGAESPSKRYQTIVKVAANERTLQFIKFGEAFENFKESEKELKAILVPEAKYSNREFSSEEIKFLFDGFVKDLKIINQYQLNKPQLTRTSSFGKPLAANQGEQLSPTQVKNIKAATDLYDEMMRKSRDKGYSDRNLSNKIGELNRANESLSKSEKSAIFANKAKVDSLQSEVEILEKQVAEINPLVEQKILQMLVFLVKVKALSADSKTKIEGLVSISEKQKEIKNAYDKYVESIKSEKSISHPLDDSKAKKPSSSFFISRKNNDEKDSDGKGLTRSVGRRQLLDKPLEEVSEEKVVLKNSEGKDFVRNLSRRELPNRPIEEKVIGPIEEKDPLKEPSVVINVLEPIVDDSNSLQGRVTLLDNEVPLSTVEKQPSPIEIKKDNEILGSACADDDLDWDDDEDKENELSAQQKLAASLNTFYKIKVPSLIEESDSEWEDSDEENELSPTQRFAASLTGFYNPSTEIKNPVESVVENKKVIEAKSKKVFEAKSEQESKPLLKPNFLADINALRHKSSKEKESIKNDEKESEVKKSIETKKTLASNVPEGRPVRPNFLGEISAFRSKSNNVVALEKKELLEKKEAEWAAKRLKDEEIRKVAEQKEIDKMAADLEKDNDSKRVELKTLQNRFEEIENLMVKRFINGKMISKAEEQGIIVQTLTDEKDVLNGKIIALRTAMQSNSVVLQNLKPVDTFGALSSVADRFKAPPLSVVNNESSNEDDANDDEWN